MNQDTSYNLKCLVVRRSLQGIDQITPAQRADVLEGVALILDGKEAEEAARAAASIRQSEDAQMTLISLLEEQS